MKAADPLLALFALLVALLGLATGGNAILFGFVWTLVFGWAIMELKGPS